MLASPAASPRFRSGSAIGSGEAADTPAMVPQEPSHILLREENFSSPMHQHAPSVRKSNKD